MFSQPECNLEAFELEPSVWELIISFCPEREIGEVRRTLGASLVEQARDLHEEGTALLEIWRQLREETDEAISRVSVPARLPEPPTARERLLQEIHFFMEYLHQRERERRGNVPVLPPENKVTLDYVLRTKGHSSRGGSRPRSAVSSRDGRETPLRHTPSSEEGSQSSALSDKVEAASEHVNATDIDTVVRHLREALEEECERRREEVQFLQQCLEEEENHQRRALHDARPEPSLQKLRELGTRLERAILEEEAPRLPPSPPARVLPRPPPLDGPMPRSVKRASKVARKVPSTQHSSPFSPSPNTPPMPSPEDFPVCTGETN